ncbi:MAG: hypothetical protein K2Y08_00345, partial [Alphaproteobacteria bacterium]|nr:hypothetical protein [Alphaproteobacteria bacterium]
SEMYERRPDLHGRMPGDRNYGSTMSDEESRMYEQQTADLYGRRPGDPNYENYENYDIFLPEQVQR